MDGLLDKPTAPPMVAAPAYRRWSGTNQEIEQKKTTKLHKSVNSYLYQHSGTHDRNKMMPSITLGNRVWTRLLPTNYSFFFCFFCFRQKKARRPNLLETQHTTDYTAGLDWRFWGTFPNFLESLLYNRVCLAFFQCRKYLRRCTTKSILAYIAVFFFFPSLVVNSLEKFSGFSKNTS